MLKNFDLSVSCEKRHSNKYTGSVKRVRLDLVRVDTGFVEVNQQRHINAELSGLTTKTKHILSTTVDFSITSDLNSLKN